MTQRPIPFPVSQFATPPPPAELGCTGSALWKEIVARWQIDDAGLRVLLDACHACDRAESLRQQIERDGEMLPCATGSSKLNPAVMAELSARGLIARLLGRLGVLDNDEIRRPGRPSNQRGGW